MNFGLFMMPLHPPHRSFADSYDRDLDLIVKADKLGYHEAWIGEHITERWENAPAPELLIAKALAMTENIILATGVTLLCLHNPVELAHRIAMLDHLARGRFYWGIGARAIPTDLELYGMDPGKEEEVRGRSREVLDIVLKIWESEGKFSYKSPCAGWSPRSVLNICKSETPQSRYLCAAACAGWLYLPPAEKMT